jgi:hypothetical protein
MRLPIRYDLHRQGEEAGYHFAETCYVLGVMDGEVLITGLNEEEIVLI